MICGKIRRCLPVLFVTLAQLLILTVSKSIGNGVNSVTGKFFAELFFEFMYKRTSNKGRYKNYSTIVLIQGGQNIVRTDREKKRKPA